MSKNDAWIVEHFSELIGKYAGKYVAVAQERLVAVGSTRGEVEKSSEEAAPGEIPSVLLVPKEEDLACLL